MIIGQIRVVDIAINRNLLIESGGRLKSFYRYLFNDSRSASAQLNACTRFDCTFVKGHSRPVRLKVLVAAKFGSGFPRRLQVLVGAQFICAMGGYSPPLLSPSRTGLLHDGYRAVGF